MPETVRIRAARDSDAGALFSLIGEIFSEYEGCVIDPGGLDSDLKQIATTTKAQGGEFWIAEKAGEVVGSVGYTVKDKETVELKRLYVKKELRRAGLATRLARLVFAAAERLGARRIELWSDTRFTEAHGFYRAHGFTPTGETRRLNDPSDTTEYRFVKPLPSAR